MAALCLLARHCLCEDMIVREGDSVTFNCSVADSMNIWITSWRISQNNRHSKTLSSCLLVEWLKPKCSRGKPVYRNKTLHHHSQLTFSNDSSFVSQLTILNIPAVMRQAVIECTYNEMTNFSSDFIQQSYNLNVYALPKTPACNARVENNSGIVNIACLISKVYPKITCQIFIEYETGVNSTDSYTRGMKTLEPVHIGDTEHKIAGYTYYSVFCNASYVPPQVGNYRFHNTIYTANNVSLKMSVKSNWITVHAQQGKQQQLAWRNKDTKDGQENKGLGGGQNDVSASNTAFTTLLVAITILGLTGVVAVFWATWSRCRKKYASADGGYGSRSNTYDFIECESNMCRDEVAPDSGYPLECADERLVLYLNNGEHNTNIPTMGERNNDISAMGEHNNDEYISIHNLLQGTYDNQTIQILRQCIQVLQSNRDANAYIIPCTPESTVRSSVNCINQDGNAYIIPCTPESTARASVNNSTHDTSGSDSVSNNDHYTDDIYGDAISDHNNHAQVISNNVNYDDDTNGGDIGSLDSTFSSSQTSVVCEEIYVST
ncbi:hypothetical protein BsWGS_22404 [Bradybaena similaris]